MGLYGRDEGCRNFNLGNVMFRVTLEQIDETTKKGRVVSMLDISPFGSGPTTRAPVGMACNVDRIMLGPNSVFEFPRDSAKAWRCIARFINDVFKEAK